MQIDWKAWPFASFSESGSRRRIDGGARSFSAFQGGCTIVQIRNRCAVVGTEDRPEEERKTRLGLTSFAQRCLPAMSSVQLRFGHRRNIVAWVGQR